MPASSPIFSFEGLWHNGEADWPCTAVAFGVEAAKAGELRLRWTGPRALFRLTVQGGREQVTELWGGWLLGRNEVVVPIPDAGAEVDGDRGRHIGAVYGVLDGVCRE